MLPDGNYLFAEEAIKARLRERIPDEATAIASISDSDELLASQHKFPGLYVLYAGDTVSERSAGSGKASQAVQHWIVAAAAKSVNRLHSGADSRMEAGKLFYQMLTALQGFEPAPGMPLTRVTCSVPIIYENGCVFKAAEFTLTVNTVGG
jgi:hypothetical protein